MPERNASVAAILDEIADLLDIQGSNPFRVRAYRNAARSVSDLGTEVDALMAQGTELTEIPGIGTDLAKKIVEILHTGSCEFLEQLHAQLPAAITQLLKIPALGPRRVRTLYQDLHIENLEQLLQAAQAGQIRALPGFGEKTEKRLLEAVRGRIAMAQRHPLVRAARQAEALADYLCEIEGVSKVEIAGSYRRMRATVGDLDVVAIAAPGSAIMDRFVTYPHVSQIISKGPTRSSVLLATGLQVDLRSVPQESFGAAMVYFTGSKAHNIAIRRMGQDRGLKINEYGVFREQMRIAGETEASVYDTIGLPWIPPELREDHGEIEAAKAGALPALMQTSDLRGDLHLRLAADDSAAALIQATGRLGLEYVGIVLDAASDDILRKLETVRTSTAEPSGPTVLVGIEAGIGLDGKLDVADALLAGLDFVIASVRAGLNLPLPEQTQRILSALQQPRVAIVAQPVAAVEAKEYDVDFAALVREATKRGIALEVSLHPERTTPTDPCLEFARREGARFVIASEAANSAELDTLPFSVGFARRAGIGPAYVLNTHPLSELQSWLRAHRQPVVA